MGPVLGQETYCFLIQKHAVHHISRVYRSQKISDVRLGEVNLVGDRFPKPITRGSSVLSKILFSGGSPDDCVLQDVVKVAPVHDSNPFEFPDEVKALGRASARRVPKGPHLCRLVWSIKNK
uniref:Uncharacterized protein n=1 Tax=Rhipicephalus zambeziensis TaxID=60191 RepID=A0A224YGN5_9ACAR